MDKVLSCIERIRVVKGVSYGIITNEQIKHLFDIFELDEEEKESVFAILKESNITPIPEDEMPQKVRDLLHPPRIKTVYVKLDKETKKKDVENGSPQSFSVAEKP